jgi:hypothetical protein
VIEGRLRIGGDRTGFDVGPGPARLNNHILRAVNSRAPRYHRTYPRRVASMLQSAYSSCLGFSVSGFAAVW